MVDFWRSTYVWNMTVHINDKSYLEKVSFIYHNYEICVFLVHVGPEYGCLPLDGKVTIFVFLFLGEGFMNTFALFTVYLLICIEISLSETGTYFMLTFHYRQSEDGKRMLQNQTDDFKLIRQRGFFVEM